MSAMTESLERWAAERGYRVAWGPASIVEEARREIAARRAGGEIETGFWEGELAAIAQDGPVASGATVVVVAKPRPAHLVGFEVDGAVVETVIPPTYVRYRPTFEEVRQDLAANGLPGARVEHLAWPVKAIAARLGLVRYGRNNVTYAEGIGSYLQLCAFLTDAELPAQAGRTVGAAQLLSQCEHCAACQEACPTGAIDGDRVLLHAARCLTYVNETSGPWPQWLPGGAHNALIGCLLCQRACPANPDLPVEPSGVRFSAEETAQLLECERGGGRVETGIAVKLAWLGQPSAEPVLGRNLRALLAARPISSSM